MQPVIERNHPNWDGVQKIYRFDNGYGASVIKAINTNLGFGSFGGSYGATEGLWELAVVKFNSEDNDDFQLCYTTPITDDVLGYLSDSEVEDTLCLIESL